MKLIKEVYTSWNAEIVFITSNWIGNKEMMEGCKEAGIPAFVSDLITTEIRGSMKRVFTGNIMGLLTYRPERHIVMIYYVPSH